MQKMSIDEFTTLLNEFIDGDNISDNDIVNNDDKTDDSCRIM
jgi:hypothetical protein